jgi:hypothetical protein
MSSDTLTAYWQTSPNLHDRPIWICGNLAANISKAYGSDQQHILERRIDGATWEHNKLHRGPTPVLFA